MTLLELSAQMPAIKQEDEQQEDAMCEETPYVEVMEKLMLGFQKMGIWCNLSGAEKSPAILKSQAC